ncbi:phage scaffolding protein [Faecousia sp.]|uniref:phage scaffolding protein n=1 Tax=Faecousia sp. TaxID=2952921 RepID=UPI003AB2D446
MDLDFLKDALGDDLFAQVAAKLEGNEGIRLANVANGSYIPKDKYDLERQNVRTQRQQIDELNGKITELTQKAEVSEALRGQLAAMQQAINESNAKMAAQRKEYAVRDIVRGSGARNADVVYRMLDTDKIAEQDGKYSGVDEQIEALKKSDPYLFNGQPPKNAGVDPAREPAGNPSPNAAINAAIRQAAGY